MRTVAAATALLAFLALLPPPATAGPGPLSESNSTLYGLRVDGAYALGPDQDQAGHETGGWGSGLPQGLGFEAPYAASGREWLFAILPGFDGPVQLKAGDIQASVWFGSTMAGIHDLGWELIADGAVLAAGAVQQVTVQQDYQEVTWTVAVPATDIGGGLAWRVYTENGVGMGARVLLGPNEWTSITLPIAGGAQPTASDVHRFGALSGGAATIAFDGKGTVHHTVNWTGDAPQGVAVAFEATTAGPWSVTVRDRATGALLGSDGNKTAGRIEHKGPAKDLNITVTSAGWAGTVKLDVDPLAPKSTGTTSGAPPTSSASTAGAASESAPSDDPASRDAPGQDSADAPMPVPLLALGAALLMARRRARAPQ